MVDVADGSVLWIGSGTSSTGGLFDFGGGGQENALFGGVPGVMGDVPGYALSPQEAERIQRLIRRMCSTLPSRLTTEW